MQRLLVILGLLFATQVRSQNSLISDNRLNAVEKPGKELSSTRIDLENTIGQQYIIMPEPKSSQDKGYQFIYDNNKKPLTYETGVGKIITLKTIKAGKGYFLDADNKEYTINSNNGSFSNLALVSEIEAARSKFLNKILWLKTNKIHLTSSLSYEEEEETSGFIGMKALVVNVIASTYDFAPLRFVIKVNNEMAYVDLRISDTNIPYYLANEYRTFESKFWTSDPNIKLKYSASMWQMIRKSQVKIGMTKKQVLLSLGEPDKINTSLYSTGKQEQWVYRDLSPGYIYIKSDRVTAVN